MREEENISPTTNSIAQEIVEQDGQLDRERVRMLIREAEQHDLVKAHKLLRALTKEIEDEMAFRFGEDQQTAAATDEEREYAREQAVLENEAEMDGVYGHVVTTTEPAWTEALHAYDPETEKPVRGTLTTVKLIESMTHDSEFECSCGRTFDHWEQAREHMKNPDAPLPP